MQKSQKKSSVFDKIKSVFRSKPPSYKFYTPGQVKVIAMKSRIYLEQYYKKCLQTINASDSILFQRKDFPNDCYQILQEIGKHVIEIQSIKIYVQILRKIQNGSAAIVKTNGDIALLKTQINWFQCVLWYRKCKKIQGLDSLHQFCYNFFKGVDITCQINPKCQIFKLYPIMLYLDPKCVLPLKKIYPQIIQYINTRIDENVLVEIFKINRDQIKKWFNKQQTEYKQRYISNSKSPTKQIFRSKQQNVSPKKYTQNQKISKNISLNDGQIMKTQQNQKDKNKTNKSQVKTSPQPSGSFMRRVIDSSSKVKDNQSSKLICIQCGTAYQKQQRFKSNNQDLSSNQQISLSQNQNICKQCEYSRIELTKQLQNSKMNKKQLLICTQCGTNMTNQQRQPNDEKYQGQQSNPNRTICKTCYRNKQLLPNNQIKIQQQQKYDNFSCNKCGILVQIKENNNVQQNQFQAKLEQQQKINKLCQNCYQNIFCFVCKQCGVLSLKQDRQMGNQMYEGQSDPFQSLCRNCVMNMKDKIQREKKQRQNLRKVCQNCNTQFSIQSTDINNNNNQLCIECQKNLIENNTATLAQQQNFQDQQQSLRFIRESVVQKKKPIKKPYMVSIYARAQYVANSNK